MTITTNFSSFKVRNIDKIMYPNQNLFGEGYFQISENILLIALNSIDKTESRQGLYKYYIDTNVFKLIFSYKPTEVCFRAFVLKPRVYMYIF